MSSINSAEARISPKILAPLPLQQKRERGWLEKVIGSQVLQEKIVGAHPSFATGEGSEQSLWKKRSWLVVAQDLQGRDNLGHLVNSRTAHPEFVRGDVSHGHPICQYTGFALRSDTEQIGPMGLLTGL